MVAFTIDRSRTYPISPLIYGVQAYVLTDEFPPWATCGRMGGNNWTPYNWKNNATNAGVDHFHFNSAFLGGGDEPAAAITGRVDKILARGAVPIVQIPMSDYVAADKLDGDVGQTPEYLTKRFRRNAPWKDVDESMTYQSEMLDLLARKYGYEKIFFSLDNEPDSWSVTHPRIFAKPTFGSYMAKARAFAHLVRIGLGDGAKIFAPSLTGYMGFLSFGQAIDANGRHFASHFLAAMKELSDANGGKRMLDVFDMHWYPEHRGSNGIRVTDDDASPETARARMDAPRSLWDESFMENSWITNDVIKKPIALLPDIQKRIDAAYPGTKIGVTEYYYGGGDHISGAIAQADVLGIFGRHGVFAANMWRWGKNVSDKFIFAAFKCFRDYDGNGSTFGDVGIQATTSDPETSSVYASAQGVIVLINKASTAQQTTIKGAMQRPFKTFVLAGDDATIKRGADMLPGMTGDLEYLMPPHSVTVLGSVTCANQN